MKDRRSAENPLVLLTREPPSIRRSRGIRFTPGEIANQCDLWPETARQMIGAREDLLQFFESHPLDEIVFTGAGSSHYLGRGLMGLFQTRFGARTMAVPATDLITHNSGIFMPDRRGLMVSFSRSGDTPESVRAVEIALKRAPQMGHWIVTCNPHGKIARRFTSKKSVRVTVLDPRTCDRGLAMTTSVTNMFVAALSCAFLDEPEVYGATVYRMAVCGNRILRDHAVLACRLAEKKFRRVAILGSGPLHAIAQEGALKITELTDGRVAALGETYLGIRHGPLTFIDGDTLVITLLSSDPVVGKYEEDLLCQMALKKLGAVRVAIGGDHARNMEPYVDQTVDIHAAMDDSLAAPLYLLFLQMLAMFSSLAWGLKPDDPSRRGVITRVVHGVTLNP